MRISQSSPPTTSVGAAPFGVKGAVFCPPPGRAYLAIGAFNLRTLRSSHPKISVSNNHLVIDISIPPCYTSVCCHFPIRIIPPSETLRYRPILYRPRNPFIFSRFRTLLHSSAGSPLFSMCSPKHTGGIPPRCQPADFRQVTPPKFPENPRRSREVCLTQRGSILACSALSNANSSTISPPTILAPSPRAAISAASTS
jgi:hypothetical protein